MLTVGAPSQVTSAQCLGGGEGLEMEFNHVTSDSLARARVMKPR